MNRGIVLEQQNMSGESHIRAVAFQEGDVWVVQGIEYDIVAQTKDPLDAPAAFLKSLVSTIMINRKMGRVGLDRIKPAPDHFREMFDNATVELSPSNRPAVGEGLTRPDIELRAFRSEAV